MIQSIKNQSKVSQSQTIVSSIRWTVRSKFLGEAAKVSADIHVLEDEFVSPAVTGVW